MKRTQLFLGLALILSALALGYVVGQNQSHSTEAQEVDAAGTQTGDILYWRAPMDPTETYDGPGKSKMGMDLIPVYANEDSAPQRPAGTVTISEGVSQQMGVRYGEVHRMDLYRSITTVGEVKINDERITQVNARFSGWVSNLLVGFEGSAVTKGQVLLEMYSPELVTTQDEYIRALNYRDNLPTSASESSKANATRLVEAAKNRLLNWEVDAEFIGHLDHLREPQQTVPIRASASGIVLTKDVIEGGYVARGSNLFKIVDLSEVWVHASFYDYELPWISEGQEVEVALSYLPGTVYKGVISYIYPILREQARDVHVRIVVPNKSGNLKPGMFANVQLAGKTMKDVVVVPTEAVIRSGSRSLVFVADGSGSFEPREVETGGEGGPGNGLVYVIRGLEAGEQVVTSAQFLIDSESRLQEAIQKMRNNKAGGGSSVPGDMSKMDHSGAGVSDMGDMKMDGAVKKTEAKPDSVKNAPMKHDH